MEPHCLGKPTDPGRSGSDNRRFVEAVLWIVRTGSRGVTCRLSLATGTLSSNATATRSKPKSAADAERLAGALEEIATVDPTFGYSMDRGSRAAVVLATDEAHLDGHLATLERLCAGAVNIGAPSPLPRGVGARGRCRLYAQETYRCWRRIRARQAQDRAERARRRHRIQKRSQPDKSVARSGPQTRAESP